MNNKALKDIKTHTATLRAYLKRWGFSCFLKISTDFIVLGDWGNMFQNLSATTWNQYMIKEHIFSLSFVFFMSFQDKFLGAN